MSLAADLASAFAERELTHPVRFGATEARGFFDEEGTLRPVLGTHVQTLQKTLYVPQGALPGLLRDETLLLGALGAASADGGVPYLINDFRPIDDGAIVAIALSGAGA